jgi:hypothetical protein
MKNKGLTAGYFHFSITLVRNTLITDAFTLYGEIMPTYLQKRLGVLCLLLIMLVLTIGLFNQALASPNKATDTLNRDQDPVVISATYLASLNGTAIDELYLYSYQSGSLTGPLPLQIDEKDGSGNYLTTGSGDNLLNGDDELVFMAMDLGDQITSTALITPLLNDAFYYELEVSDPLSPTNKGWAYLISSTDILTTSDYVAYDEALRQILARDYQLDFSSTFMGFDYLELFNSGVDLLDRTKLRVAVSGFDFTEENLSNPPKPTVIKDGPVRLILEQNHAFFNGAATIKSTSFVYAGQMKTETSLQSIIAPDSARTSFDMNAAAVVSPTTFYNANQPGGVTVDGSPDAGVGGPLSRWSQISHPTGRLIQITDFSAAGGTITTYYRDDSSFEDSSGAEPGSYGDSGPAADNLPSTATSVQLATTQYILPPASSGPDNVGALHAQYVDQPLRITAKLIAPNYNFLPLILK